MSDTGKQDVTTRPGRGLRIVLAVSLGLNLLVAGIVAGTILQDGPPHRLESVRDLGFGPFSEALTSADRTALRQDFLDRANDMRAMRDGMRREAEALLIVLRAEPFDPEALRTQMAHMVSRMGERVALGQDLLADHLAQMSPEDRQAFADRFEKSLRKGHGLRAGHRD